MSYHTSVCVDFITKLETCMRNLVNLMSGNIGSSCFSVNKLDYYVSERQRFLRATSILLLVS